jgi:DnaK suppressor protein
VNKQDLMDIQQMLFDEKAKLMTKIQEFKFFHLRIQESGQDEVEISAHDIHMNLAIEIQERDRLALIRIDKALHKIESGIYGVCEACGAHIEIKRLFIQPLARLCIDCMTEFEIDSKNPFTSFSH